MNREELLKNWLQEEEIAHIHGWDFSHIKDRYEEGKDLPWDYKEIIKKYLSPDRKLLDIDTGGGEFLLSLNHPYHNLAATESYPPNVELCREVLLPLGVDFREMDGCDEHYPFKDESFDMVINRHGEFNAGEIHRILKPGGLFITQQVGAENDRELVELLLKEAPPLPFPRQYLEIIREEFEDAGFTTLEAQEAYGPIRFYDVGALVWFARVIPWEFPEFHVLDCAEQLCRAQEMLEKQGVIQGRTHRFLLCVRK